MVCGERALSLDEKEEKRFSAHNLRMQVIEFVEAAPGKEGTQEACELATTDNPIPAINPIRPNAPLRCPPRPCSQEGYEHAEIAL